MPKAPIKKIRKRNSIAIIMPTFNSSALVNEHLDLLERQTRRDFDVIIIDSGKSKDHNLINSKRRFGVIVKYFEDDLGGSGSAFEGMKYAYENGYSYMILTDSDAYPISKNLVDELVKITDEKTVAYGTNIIKRYKEGEGPLKEEIRWAPWHYLSFSRETITKLGYPRRDFFIYNDDVEYSNRIVKVARIMQLNKIFYRHLNSTLTTYFTRGMSARSSYYTLRNRMLSKEGLENKLSVLLNSFTRTAIGAYYLDGRNLLAYWSYLSQGVVDGFLGKAGSRPDIPKIELGIDLQKTETYPKNAVYLTYPKKDNIFGKIGGKATKGWEVVDISKGINDSAVMKLISRNCPVIVNDYLANQQITTRLMPFLLMHNLYIFNEDGLFSVSKKSRSE